MYNVQYLHKTGQKQQVVGVHVLYDWIGDHVNTVIIKRDMKCTCTITVYM